MRTITTELNGVLLIEPDVFRDSRGFFLESYHRLKYRDLGIIDEFVQDNHSRSAKGTIRGLHAQRLHPQGKLIRVLSGEIVDVVADIRRGSPTFGSWDSFRLTADNFLQCYVPPGFAHGFCVMSDYAEIEYKCTDFYDPSGELRIIWNDPTIGVRWPVEKPLLSAGDNSAKPIAELIDFLPIYETR
jgi:dTDP-4-dehydrorhamnose 3,5-epimerase